jgi:hypothetical protein
MIIREQRTGKEFSFPKQMNYVPWDCGYELIPEDDQEREMLDRFGYQITERTPDTTNEDLTNAVEFVRERPRPEPLLERSTSKDDTIEAWLKKKGIEVDEEDGLWFILVTEGTPADVLRMRIDGNGLAEPCPNNELQNIVHQLYGDFPHTEEKVTEKLRKEFGHISIRDMIKVYSIMVRQMQDEERLALSLRRSRLEQFAAYMDDRLAERDHVD